MTHHIVILPERNEIASRDKPKIFGIYLRNRVKMEIGDDGRISTNYGNIISNYFAIYL
jgi:hypothetical protein